MHKVEMYTTPSCVFCKMAKDFFQARGVEYQEFNVAEDMAKQKEMIDKSGQMGVPVIVVDGSNVIVGFDQPKLSELLGIK